MLDNRWQTFYPKRKLFYKPLTTSHSSRNSHSLDLRWSAASSHCAACTATAKLSIMKHAATASSNPTLGDVGSWDCRLYHGLTRPPIIAFGYFVQHILKDLLFGTLLVLVLCHLGHTQIKWVIVVEESGKMLFYMCDLSASLAVDNMYPSLPWVFQKEAIFI